MSALQRYKKEAKELAEENKRLREELAALKSPRKWEPHFGPEKLTALESKIGSEVAMNLLKSGDAVMRKISSLMLDPGGRPLAGSYIAEALMEAYAEGMDSTEE